MYFIQKSLLNPILTLIFKIASNTHLNNKKNLSSVMDLPSRSKPCKGNEIKTIPPYFSNFPGHRTNRLTNSLCTLLEKTKALYIYTHIRVAIGTGDTTSPIAYEDHSSSGAMR
jgi:hypothetical protein